RIAKGSASQPQPTAQGAPAAGAPAAGASQPNPPGGVMSDDTGIPELAKIQLVGFTFVAVGIFVATLIHQIATNPSVTALPNIDSSLLVLMGISQGGYLGKKLVSYGSPMLNPIVPPIAAPSTQVTITGASLGATPMGSQLILDGTPIGVGTWTDSAITFAVPNQYPVGPAPWGPKQ